MNTLRMRDSQPHRHRCRRGGLIEVLQFPFDADQAVTVTIDGDQLTVSNSTEKTDK